MFFIFQSLPDSVQGMDINALDECNSLKLVVGLDQVQALDFYDQNKKIKPKDFEKEWLEPAAKTGAAAISRKRILLR